MGNVSGEHLLALVNLVLCIAIVHACICRLNMMSKDILLVVRIRSIIILNCAMASGLQPFWGDWPGWGTIAMSGAVICDLIISSSRWAAGPPADCHIPSKRLAL